MSSAAVSDGRAVDAETGSPAVKAALRGFDGFDVFGGFDDEPVLVLLGFLATEALLLRSLDSRPVLPGCRG